MNHLTEDQNLTFTAEQRRYLNGPIALHNPGWADTVPEWLTAAISAARLEFVPEARLRSASAGTDLQ
jgi:hypothetical protein